jgi:hypothetical protein
MSIVACPKPPASLASHYRARLLRCDIPQPAAGKRWTATHIDDQSRDASERDKTPLLRLANARSGYESRMPTARTWSQASSTGRRCRGHQRCTCMALGTCRRVVYRVSGFTRTICARAGVRSAHVGEQRGHRRTTNGLPAAWSQTPRAEAERGGSATTVLGRGGQG